MEELHGTKQMHTNWTGTAGEQTMCHFIRRLTNPDGTTSHFRLHACALEPTDDDIIQLLRDHGIFLSPPDRLRYKAAHNATTSSAFHIPPVDNNFLWPYCINTSHDDPFHLPDVEDKFYNSIGSIPGKARHRGFTMQVLGRTPLSWSKWWSRGNAYILTSRIAPKAIKEMSRLPIPKPKPGETRPIALIHDTWAFLTGLVHDHLAHAVEISGVLDHDVTAYRKGKSAVDIMTSVICMIEEAHTTGDPLVLLDEDEEKFFDRIHHELQGATMIACGMPDQGYIEFKNEDMEGRQTFVITNRGMVQIEYAVGLPQARSSVSSAATSSPTRKCDNGLSTTRPTQ